MRLHELTVSAFGPFAATVSVDFAELNAAGLFLMTGATGAGKSSLLDAVCFALYGAVPGVRTVKTLKSQHAPADAAPEVVLDFEAQGRRFVVRRSPEWTRPKRRGDGRTTVKAAASIIETTDGTEQLLSARAAEVGLLVTELMGMRADQFVQVALLPQGEFQTFLRATTQDRHTVLQQLFRTERFTRIEDWVHERSRALRDRSRDGEAAVRRVLDTAAHRADVDLPDELTGERLAGAAADGRVLAWLDGLAEAADLAAQRAEGRERGEREVLEVARTGYAEASHELELRRRVGEARRVLVELDGSADDAHAVRQRLAADQRAAPGVPLLELRARAQQAHAAATDEHDHGLRLLRRGDLLPDGSKHDLAAAVEVTAAGIARLEQLLPLEEESKAARVQRKVAEQELAQVEGAVDDVTTRAAALPLEVEHLEEACAADALLATRVEPLTIELAAARRQHQAATSAVATAERLAELEDALRDGRDAVQDARERALDLRARRLAGMAAELASALVPGTACSVCGSTDHPAAARPASDAVGEEDESSAAEQVERLRTALAEAEETTAAVRRRHHELVVASAGRSAEEATGEVARLQVELTSARAATASVEQKRRRLSELRAEQATLGDRRTVLAARAATLHESLTGLDRVMAAAAARLAGGLRGLDLSAATAEEALLALRSRHDRVTRVQQAQQAVDGAALRLAELDDQTESLARAQGFSSLPAMRAAVLSDIDRDLLTTQQTRRDDTLARVRAVLDDPAVTGLPAAAPDVAGLAEAVRRAEAEVAAVARLRTLHDDRVTALRRLRDRLAVEIEAWAPLRDDALRAASMAALVRGMGADNQLQMRLSAYVLATRLDQVVAAANERLVLMRDQRYLLQRTGRVDRRGSQAGLGLEVVDQWTGDVRAPSTLSGGETFVVSLALALGLADVVTHEAGGTEMDTLFVDEGFGTLDSDTLDDVMDRLDALRAGGRTVCVVSHVTELRSRIPTQVQVDKGRNGSSVAVRTLVG